MAVKGRPTHNYLRTFDTAPSVGPKERKKPDFKNERRGTEGEKDHGFGKGRHTNGIVNEKVNE